VRVVRLIPNALTDCREIAFSVVDPPSPPPWYNTTICHDHDAWHWALAEPAVARWNTFGH
jgi:hypothetical protein